MPGFLKPYRPFLLFATLFFTSMFVLEHVNGRFLLNDFRVYWSAADALLNGKQVYGLPFGENTGFYKYSPFAAMLVVPLALLPFQVASVIWFWCIATASVALIILLHRVLEQETFGRSVRRPNLFLSLSLLCIGNHLVRELHLGNVNVFVLLFAAIAFRIPIAKPKVAGALLALLFMVKPYLGILFVPFVLRGQWKVLAAASAAGVVMLLLPVVFGFSKAMELHVEWLQAMSQHGEYLTSGNTVSSFLHRLTGVADAAPLQLCIIAAALGLIALVVWREQAVPLRGDKRFLLFFGILAILPNLVITDTQHFLFALPLFMFVLHYLSQRRDPTVLAVFVVICLLHGGNSSDLLGSDLSDRMNAWGALGMANLLLIGLCAWLASRSDGKTTSA